MMRIKNQYQTIKDWSIHQGYYIYLGRTDHNICKVKAILLYLALQSNVAGPPFVLKNGRIVIHQIFSVTLDGILEELHLKKETFNAHGFCIGGATSSKAADASDTQGR